VGRFSIIFRFQHVDGISETPAQREGLTERKRDRCPRKLVAASSASAR
jgi:hypothetical protein